MPEAADEDGERLYAGDGQRQHDDGHRSRYAAHARQQLPADGRHARLRLHPRRLRRPRRTRVFAVAELRGDGLSRRQHHVRPLRRRLHVLRWGRRRRSGGEAEGEGGRGVRCRPVSMHPRRRRLPAERDRPYGTAAPGQLAGDRSVQPGGRIEVIFFYRLQPCDGTLFCQQRVRTSDRIQLYGTAIWTPTPTRNKRLHAAVSCLAVGCDWSDAMSAAKRQSIFSKIVNGIDLLFHDQTCLI